MKNQESMPDRRWIGKTLEITEAGVFNILEGSELRGIELREGQKLKVVGEQKGNWLQCVLLDKAEFQRAPGIQMSEFEINWQEKQHGPYGDVHSSKGIIIGVSLNFDRDRFRIVEDTVGIQALDKTNKAYDRKESEKLSKHFNRVFDNTPNNLGYKYKKKGTYGPFYSRNEALKLIHNEKGAVIKSR